MKKKQCVVRTPLVYGSEACTNTVDARGSDVCKHHLHLLGGHQLINGVLYVKREDE